MVIRTTQSVGVRARSVTFWSSETSFFRYSLYRMALVIVTDLIGSLPPKWRRSHSDKSSRFSMIEPYGPLSQANQGTSVSFRNSW